MIFSNVFKWCFIESKTMCRIPRCPNWQEFKLVFSCAIGEN